MQPVSYCSDEYDQTQDNLRPGNSGNNNTTGRRIFRNKIAWETRSEGRTNHHANVPPCSRIIRCQFEGSSTFRFQNSQEPSNDEDLGVSSCPNWRQSHATQDSSELGLALHARITRECSPAERQPRRFWSPALRPVQGAPHNRSCGKGRWAD